MSVIFDRSNIKNKRDSSGYCLSSTEPLIDKKSENDRNKKDWDEFIDWCTTNNYNPKNGEVLRKYIKTRLERN